MLPGSLAACGSRTSDNLSTGCLHAGSEPWLPVVASTSCFTLPPSLQAFMERKCPKKSVHEEHEGGEAVAQKQPHPLGHWSQYLVAQRHIMTGGFICCSGWPYLLFSSDVPYTFHNALLHYLHNHWITRISSTWSTGAVFTCWDEIVQKLPGVWDLLTTLTMLSWHVKAIAWDVAIAACKQLH